MLDSAGASANQPPLAARQKRIGAKEVWLPCWRAGQSGITEQTRVVCSGFWRDFPVRRSCRLAIIMGGFRCQDSRSCPDRATHPPHGGSYPLTRVFQGLYISLCFLRPSLSASLFFSFPPSPPSCFPAAPIDCDPRLINPPTHKRRMCLLKYDNKATKGASFPPARAKATRLRSTPTALHHRSEQGDTRKGNAAAQSPRP
jgi:hypothetical protein